MTTITFDSKEFRFQLLETQESMNLPYVPNEVVTYVLGDGYSYGMVSNIAQSWFKSKGAYRSQRPKNEPRARDYSNYDSPQIMMPLNLYGTDDYSKYTLKQFVSSYIISTRYLIARGKLKQLAWGVPIATVYNGKGKLVIGYTLYVTMSMPEYDKDKEWT